MRLPRRLIRGDSDEINLESEDLSVITDAGGEDNAIDASEQALMEDADTLRSGGSEGNEVFSDSVDEESEDLLGTGEDDPQAQAEANPGQIPPAAPPRRWAAIYQRYSRRKPQRIRDKNKTRDREGTKIKIRSRLRGKGKGKNRFRRQKMRRVARTRHKG